MDDLNQEIEARLQAMESPDYTFPPRFGRRDYFTALLVALICFLALLGGAFL
jgi:hypothetical protein